MRTFHSGPRLVKPVLKLAVLLALLAALFLWFAGTDYALRAMAWQAETVTGGKLSLTGVHGSLYGPMHVDSLSFSTDASRYEVRGLELDWSPAALLHGLIKINEVNVHSLQIVDLKASPKPLELPGTLRLPLSLSMPEVRVGKIVFGPGESDLVFTDLDAAIEKPADGYVLKLASLTTPWGVVHATGTLGDSRPFKVEGQASLSQEHDWPYAVQTTVSGTLPRLVLAAVATSSGGKAQAQATLTPFEVRPFAEARIEASRVDPSRIDRQLPSAEIRGMLTLHGQGDEAFSGEVRIENARPGPWDRARLPVRTLSARLAGKSGHIELSGVLLDLGAGGRLDGLGKLDNGNLKLDLQAHALDPGALYSALHAMKLSGPIHLAADAKTQAVRADLADKHYRLALDLAHEGERLEIRKAVARSAGGSLSLAGNVGLVQPRPFQFDGTLSNLDPAAFGDFPSAQLNASFSGSGRLAPAPEARLNFKIADSRLRRQPLSGAGRLDISAKRIKDADLRLRLGHDSLEANGSLGAPGDRLGFRLAADNLAVIDPRLAGRVMANGKLEGAFAALSGTAELDATGLRLGKSYSAARLKASAKIEKGLDGRLSFQGLAQGVTSPKVSLKLFSATVHGSRARHSIEIRASSPDIDLAARLEGGWHDKTGWSGQIADLVNHGHRAFTLRTPARLEVAADRVLLANARADFGRAEIFVRKLSYDAGQFASQGEFKTLPAALLFRFANTPIDTRTNLTLGGEWQIDAHDTVNGEVKVWRDGGDIVLPGEPKTSLGLDRLNLSLQAKDNRIDGSLEASGTRLGRIMAGAQTVLSRRNETWGIAGSAPIRANADLSMQSLAWVAPFMDKTGALVVDGSLKGKLSADGQISNPRVTGFVTGEGVKIGLPEQGVQLRDGQFSAELRDQVLELKSFSLRADKGSLTGQGRLDLKDGKPTLQLNFKADRLNVLARPDRSLTLSGSGAVSVTPKDTQVTAKLKLDQGLIELPKDDTPTLSSDVVVLGRDQAVGKPSTPYALNLDLDLNLGDHFYLKGRGMDAQVGGAVKIVSQDGALPSATGSIHVVKGTYAAYGQRLDIERGILNFQGPIDNPGLNIVAMRKNQEVEAGVAITGSAQSPQVKLVSNPTVPDTEKLSWLILGHGLEGSSGQEFSALQIAAGTLLSAGESITLQQKIAHTAGLDEVSLKGDGTLESTVLTLGKRLSSRTYLSYEQGVGSANTLMKINYSLSKHISIRAQAGAVPAIDLFYTIDLD